MVVGDELKEPIRAHHDIAKEKAQHLYKATKVNSNFVRRLYLPFVNPVLRKPRQQSGG